MFDLGVFEKALWINVQEELPSRRFELLTCNNWGIIDICYYENQCFKYAFDGAECKDVGYWRYLPQLPEELNNG